MKDQDKPITSGREAFEQAKAESRKHLGRVSTRYVIGQLLNTIDRLLNQSPKHN